MPRPALHRLRNRKWCLSWIASMTAVIPSKMRTSVLWHPHTIGACRASSEHFSGYMAGKAIKNRKIDACYCIRMVDTWTPIFDLSTPEKTAKYTKTTETDIDNVIRCVRERHVNRHMSPRTPAIFTELIAQPIYDRKVRRTSKFRVEETCVGCGLCAKKCPVQAIEIQGKKPVWVKEKCVMCLGCLHRCPKFAIQYGRRTRHHGQYTNPNVKL